MERTMSVEERIRRAENIYNRRNGINYSRTIDSKPKKEKKKNIKKLFMQIFICLLIYIVFYAVSNREFIFSKEFRNEINIFFTEKTKINEWFTNIKSYLNEKLNGSKEQEEPSEEKKEDKNSEKVEENNNKEQSENKSENIGGAEEAKEEKNDANNEISQNDKMKLEAQEIKSKISFINPIEGRISSTFGWRNPTSASVPKYHTGLDIAANEGTVIKSATDGKVIMASKIGDYGNHYQIQSQNIIIIYAHCKKLYLKEGDAVKQGQEIAEVGSTGNSTGPHLHFEIRKGDEKIDPQLVLDI